MLLRNQSIDIQKIYSRELSHPHTMQRPTGACLCTKLAVDLASKRDSALEQAGARENDVLHRTLQERLHDAVGCPFGLFAAGLTKLRLHVWSLRGKSVIFASPRLRLKHHIGDAYGVAQSQQNTPPGVAAGPTFPAAYSSQNTLVPYWLPGSAGWRESAPAPQ